MTDAAVFATNPRFIVAKRFIASESLHDVRHRVGIRMKFTYVMIDVFFRRISEQLEFRFVRPQNATIRAYTVETFNGIFKKVSEILLDGPQLVLGAALLFERLQQRPLDFLAMLNLRFQSN